MLQLIRSARVPLVLNADGVREVAIVTDTAVETPVIEALAAAALALGMQPTIVMFTPRAAHGHEPPQVAAAALRGADLILAACSTAMTHTEAVRAALRAGVKYVSMPGITVEGMLHGAATADYGMVGKITAVVAQTLSNGNAVRITTAQGSDLRFSIAGRPCARLDGVYRPGAIGCFPDGEAALAIVEETAEGVLVGNSSIAGVGLLRDPVRLEFKQGRVVNLSGGEEADALRRLLQTQGDANSWNAGEFAIGTNPAARRSENVHEDKKRLGTIHVGLGDNLTLGGANKAKTHLDVVVSNVNVWVDDVQVLREGTLLLTV